MLVRDYVKKYYPSEKFECGSITEFADDNGMSRQNATNYINNENMHVVEFDGEIEFILRRKSLLVNKFEEEDFAFEILC